MTNEQSGQMHRFVTPEGAHFQMHLQVLRQAAEVTDRAFTRQISHTEALMKQLPTSADEDLAMSEGRDPYELLTDELVAAEGAANEARKAFAIAAYHFWEHAVAQRIRADVATGCLGENWLRASGKKLDNRSLEYGWVLDPSAPAPAGPGQPFEA